MGLLSTSLQPWATAKPDGGSRCERGITDEQEAPRLKLPPETRKQGREVGGKEGLYPGIMGPGKKDAFRHAVCPGPLWQPCATYQGQEPGIAFVCPNKPQSFQQFSLFPVIHPVPRSGQQ